MMTKVIVTLLILLTPLMSYSKTFRIAVIDTGFNRDKIVDAKFCANESKDFTGTDLNDRLNHGTHVINLITKNLKNIDYCIVMVKWFNTYGTKKTGYIEALKYTVEELKPDLINLSLTSQDYDKNEKKYIEKLLNNSTVVVAAAGNSSKDLNNKCDVYPACLNDKIIVVGSLNSSGKKASYSNYGDKIIKVWHISDATSFACAMESGFITKKIMSKP